MPSTDAEPVTSVRVELSAKVPSALGPPLARALTEAVRGLKGELGIPGGAAVEMSTTEQPLPLDRFLRLSVGGRLCRHPDRLLRRVYAFHAQCFGDATDRPSHLLDRVLGRRENEPGLDESTTVAFLTSICLEAIKQAPAVLLGPEETAAYAAALPSSAKQSYRRPSPTWLAPLLQQVLNLRASLVAGRVVADVLATRDAPELVVEQLFERLRPGVVEILLSPLALEQVLDSPPQSMGEMFRFLREGLAAELGLTYPPFTFVPASDLQGRTFAFRLGALRTTPFLGLGPDECLVNESWEKVGDLKGRRAINPATGAPAAIIPLSARKSAEDRGLTAWDARQHLMLALAGALRTNGRLFVTESVAAEVIEKASSMSPPLAQVLARSSLDKVDVTRVLRTLAAEEINIGNSIQILEILAERVHRSSRGSDAATVPNCRDLVADVRAGLRRQLRAKYSRRTETVVVYLLDPQIEKLAAATRGRGLDRREVDQVVGAVAAEMEFLPPTAQVPVLLTRRDLRPMIRELTACELPQLSVLSYDDLPPDTNIQPVARISLSSS
jgi:type III secretion protein V